MKIFLKRSDCSFAALANVCAFKIQVEDFIYENRLSDKTPGMFNPLFTTWCTGRYTAVYRLCPRMIHGQGAFYGSIFPQLSPFLELSKARASEASVRPRGRRPFTSPGHSGRVIPRTTCYARHIRCKSTSPELLLVSLGVEVPNELLLKSNSRFPRRGNSPRHRGERICLPINLMNERKKVC